ncbi:GCN2 [Candida pseudojiufengensis]|uniref:GCN2 n=1 Tax=Candida pseudojiufengensis TaxID=497109 RepID=UPI002224D718|nr:GCN2 [Candida pseudojiufengensis]KAI5960796.1 GCN2 [Candida pseudojiufengensis]
MKEESISSELEHRQEDELNSIESIYGDIFKNITPKDLIWNRKPPPHFQVNLSSHEVPDNPEVSIVLDIEFTPTYPLSSPKVKFLNPNNLLKAHVAKLKSKVDELIKEYKEEEVSFTIISESKFILDEIQSTTGKVLSLEEEREQRLKNERKALEEKEARQQRDKELSTKKRSKELNEQIQKIKKELVEESDDEDDIEDIVPLPVDQQNYFVFENEMEDSLPNSRVKFKFRAVSGFIKYTKKGTFSSIGRQMIVKPFVTKEIQQLADRQGLELTYLLTEIDLTNLHWQKDKGKHEIQDLEKELQNCLKLKDPHILKLIGFQIDKVQGWKVRLLNEFSFVAESLNDMIPSKGGVSLPLTRKWLMDLIPVIEQLHNSGIIHKSISSLTVVIFDDVTIVDNSAYSESNSSALNDFKIIKLCHPSYGYKLNHMIETYPNEGSSKFLKDKFQLPESWKAPEIKNTGMYNPKTDVWDLGVLLLKLFMGKDTLIKDFPTPDDFHKNFVEKMKLQNEEYAESVYDLLSKLLQSKSSKRPTLMELNAIKFLRDGPVLKQNPSLHYLNKFPRSPTMKTRRKLSNELKNQETNSLNSESQKQKNSRYNRDFEEIGRLGKGGFGDVVKSRNRMEGTFYAIKKIKHRANKLDSILSEVLSLARLNHQYIVRYYSTWVEEDEELDNNNKDSDLSSVVPTVDEEAIEAEENDTSNLQLTSSSSYLPAYNSSFQVDYISRSFDPNTEFDDESFGNRFEDDDDEDGFVFANSTDIDNSNEKEENADTTASSSSNDIAVVTHSPKNKQVLFPKSILYIQMEFCENNTLMNLIEQGLPGNPNEYWRLFRQLLEAVSYIHREGFIHRDLKPMNIFIDRSNNIKVGDFGLAKNSQFLPSIQQKLQIDKTANKNGGGDLSTVVGTALYTAPEVASGRYDDKVDMFSLGVIFFEMCYPLATGMERAMILNKLRQQVYPSNWKNSLEKNIVEQLLNHNPEERPSASDLLQSSNLPIEHQDQVIREALKSLADPASPWQQQVRETLFNQPYSLAKDLLFDSGNTYSEYSAGDYLLFNKIVHELVGIFHKHGAVENINTNLVLPKIPNLQKNQVYEFLDKSGSVVTLPYDLILPVARFLSKNEVNVSKFFRHEFVYRPNLRGVGMPEKYSAMNFNIISSLDSDIINNDAECIKIADEILHMIPDLPVQKVILINSHEILNSVVSFAFENVPIEDKKKIDVFQVLSQLGIDKTNNEVKKILREDFQIPRTVIEDLIGNFKFTCSIHEARHKLQKLMIDSPHLIKVEKSFAYLIKVLEILKQFQVQSEILFNPLVNYDNQYYRHGLMFQAVLKSEKSKRLNRIITGGRFDSLINSFRDISVTTTSSNSSKQYNAVGFTLTTSFLFTLMKNIISRKIPNKIDLLRWKGNRCDVIVSSTQQDNIDICGYEILGKLWSKNISADILNARTQDEIIHQAHLDGAQFVVLIRQSQQLVNKKHSKKSSIYKPLKIKCLRSGKDADFDNYDDLVQFLSIELGEDETVVQEYDEDEIETEYDETKTEESTNLIELNQKVIVVNNEAPRGRKNNKRERWEVENKAKSIGSKTIQSLAQGPVLTFDLRDEVLDMISITSIHQQDEWIRKVVFSSNNLPKSFAMNILNNLVKESLKGHKWCILVSSRTHYTTIVDLRR